MRLSEVLNERIYADKGKLEITIQKNREASTKEAISTYFNRIPYEANLKGAYGTIYSILNYVSSPEVTNLLSSIKGKGPYTLNHNQLSRFMDDVTKASMYVLDKHKPNVIIYPKSSSSLVSDYCARLKEKYPDADVISDAYVKRVLDPDHIEPLINKNHPEWDEFSKDHPDEVRKMVRSLSNAIKNNNGKIEIKKLYATHRKFIKGFVGPRDEDIEYELLDKIIGRNVLILDDVLSTGSTMIEIMRQISEFEPKSVNGMTIFKHTSQAREA